MENFCMASLPICNNASLNIYNVDDYFDIVEAGINNQKKRKYKLYTNTKGTYFNYGKTRFYLHEFLRTNQ